MKKTLLSIFVLSGLSLINPCHAENRIGETPQQLQKRWKLGEIGKDDNGFPTLTWKKEPYTITAYFSSKKFTCFKIEVKKGWHKNILTKEEALKFISQFCPDAKFPTDKQNKENVYDNKIGTLNVHYENWYWPQAGAQLGQLTIYDSRLEKIAEVERKALINEEALGKKQEKQKSSIDSL